jgi:hypothetical protein
LLCKFTFLYRKKFSSSWHCQNNKLLLKLVLTFYSKKQQSKKLKKQKPTTTSWSQRRNQNSKKVFKLKKKESDSSMKISVFVLNCHVVFELKWLSPKCPALLLSRSRSSIRRRPDTSATTSTCITKEFKVRQVKTLSEMSYKR